MTQRYNGVDIGKFVCALCVVTYHALASFYGRSDQWFVFEHAILRLSVPFFFVASGFFLGKKNRQNTKKRRNYFGSYLKRLAFLYVVWGIPAIGIDLAYAIHNGMGLSQALKVELHKTILLHNGIMWYIGALIFAIAVIYFLNTEKRLRISIILGCAAYMAGMLLDSYSGITTGTPMAAVVLWYKQTFLSVNNGFFVGFVFTAIGYREAFYPQKRSLQYDLGMLAFGYGVFCVELFILSLLPVSLTGTYDCTLHMLILDPVLFRIALRPWKSLPQNTGYFHFASTFLYFTHMILITGLYYLFDLDPAFQYVLVLIIELGAAAAVYRLDNTWIKKLF